MIIEIKVQSQGIKISWYMLIAIHVFLEDREGEYERVLRIPDRHAQDPYRRTQDP